MLSIYTQFSVVGAEKLHSDRILRSRFSLHYFQVCYVATILLWIAWLHEDWGVGEVWEYTRLTLSGILMYLSCC